MQDTDTGTTPTYPFAPLTDVGLSIAIEEHASVLTHATTQHRHFEPRVRAEAVLLIDMCQARTNRMIHLAFGRVA